MNLGLTLVVSSGLECKTPYGWVYFYHILGQMAYILFVKKQYNIFLGAWTLELRYLG
jgi:hypothetical protein